MLLFGFGGEPVFFQYFLSFFPCYEIKELLVFVLKSCIEDVYMRRLNAFKNALT